MGWVETDPEETLRRRGEDEEDEKHKDGLIIQQSVEKRTAHDEDFDEGEDDRCFKDI